MVSRLVPSILALLILQCTPGIQKDKRLVVLSGEGQNTMYRAIIQDINQFAEQNGYEIAVTEDQRYTSEDSLSNISALIFLEDPSSITAAQQRNLERYYQSGGGLVLLRQEMNRYQWPWYYRLTKTQQDSDPEKPAGRVLLLDTLQLDQADLPNHLQRLIGDNRWHPREISSIAAPDFNRFTVKLLDDEINEPMQMAVLPSGKVLFVEREGLVKLYHPELKKTKVIGNLEVSTSGNYEDGLLGVTIDPQYHRNNWIYIFYSPLIEKPVQYVSRFRLAYEDSLIMASEKVILEIPVQRETCCHSGGGLEFGPEGLLYISTGDNTSSKESDGFSPIDERPGRAPFDAQKSSGNTHDLRGKILRIEPQPDGSYKIPVGNLFPPDGSRGRPEIYVMGCRNPFRFSIDAKTGYLYWGDVGPDGGVDGPQGPQSYDEWNQAKSSGNYGWPYFVADNKAYADLDFATMEIGPYFDPDRPLNESPNNTGAKELPPAQIPLIWYGYGSSEIWPMLGTGSRSAMAGPVYYGPKKPTTVSFPAYYQGKMFIYEWARSWIKVVSLNEQGDLDKIEDFIPGLEISKPIDLEFSRDGALYILAYGANYFANNEDARLVKIEYAHGNRVPVPSIIASPEVGALPHSVSFSASNSLDYDLGDSLHYKWMIGNDTIVFRENVSHTFKESGRHEVELWAYDSKGDSAVTTTIIRSGNARPEINIDFDDNSTFYFDGQGPLSYRVSVMDKEDGSTINNQINASQVVINFNYLPQGKDLAELGPDLFKRPTAFLQGRRLMDNSDCSTCHDYQIESRGPSYQAIADRYHGGAEVTLELAQKVIDGGTGNWGSALMAAHPQLSLAETTAMVKYILSLATGANKGGLPLNGEVAFTEHQHNPQRGEYLFTAYYQDQGATGADALASYESLIFRHPEVEAEEYHDFLKVSRQRPDGGNLEYINARQQGSYIMFQQVDLRSIRQLTLKTRVRQPAKVTVYLDDPQGGELWGEIVCNPAPGGDWRQYRIDVNPTTGKKDLYFVFSSVEQDDPLVLDLDWMLFEPGTTLP